MLQMQNFWESQVKGHFKHNKPLGGASPAVPWLRPHASTAGSSVQGNKILHSMRCGQKIKYIKLLGTDSWLTDSTSPSACSAESVTAVLVVEEDGCVLLQLPVSLTEFLKLGSLLCWCLEFWEGHFSPPLSRKNHILSHAQSGHCSSFAENPGAV